jgi:cysteine desulfurase / selenocysteine lyase
MHKYRKDFPILKQKVNGHPLIYFDNAATSQKPQQMIDALSTFYTQYNNNIHRSVHALAEQTTTLYEQARAKVAQFINADPEEIIFTKGTTEGINFIANTWAQHKLEAKDQIVLSELEHHSNIIPWQQLAEKKGINLAYIPVLQDGMLDYDALTRIIDRDTKLVSITAVSNALGTHVDLPCIIKAAHAVDARILVDAAQLAPHCRIDVKQLNCDFLVFSGHKMLGPTGIGVLYIKKTLHKQTLPYQYGGGMVYEANYDTATYVAAPHCYEAGTPPIAQAIALGAVIDYLDTFSFDALHNHEAALCAQLIEGLSAYNRITMLGPIEQLKKKGHLVSFIVKDMHAHDVAAYLSKYGIAVRAGHHCAQPLAKKLGIAASVRVSFYLYNTHEEVEKFLEVIRLLISNK